MASTSDWPSVGIIGMGEMGRMYAKYLSNGGKRRWVTVLIYQPCHIITNASLQSERVRPSGTVRAAQGGLPEYELLACDPWRCDMLILGVGADTANIHVYENGHYVARISDFIVYSVEAEYIDAVVKEYGPCEESTRTERLHAVELILHAAVQLQK